MRYIFALTLLILASACATTTPSDAVGQSAIRLSDGSSIAKVEFDDFVRTQREELDIPGLSLAVITDQDISHTLAIGVENIESGKPVTGSSVFEAASLSKPMFAYLVMKLSDAGIIDIDRPLHLYLPMEELEPEGAYHPVTARMALSHQTGFPRWRWFDPAPAELGLEHGAMYMKGEPGTFGYSGEGYNYLAMVIAHLTGRDLTSLNPLFENEVAKPLGLDCSAFVLTECVEDRKVMGHMNGAIFADYPRSYPEDTPQTFGAAGRLHTTAEDYARFMIALMKGDGLSSNAHSQMLSGQITIPVGHETRKLTGETAWALGIAIEPTPFGVRFEHGGNNGNFQSGMMFMPDAGIGYVVLTNSDKGSVLVDRLEAFFDKGAN